MADSGLCRFSNEGFSTNAALYSTFWHLRSLLVSRSRTDQKQISGWGFITAKLPCKDIHQQAACTTDMALGFG